MTAPNIDQLREVVSAEVERFLAGIGSLFATGQPSSPALATPTGFGLVEVEKTEAAPMALNAKCLYRILCVETQNNTGVPVSTQLSFPVEVGRAYMIEAYLHIGSGAGATGGVIFSLSGPGFTEVDGTVSAMMANASTWQAFPRRGANQLSGQNVCNFDMSASEGWVEIKAFVNPSAAGTVTLNFMNGTGGQNLIIRQGSQLRAFMV